MFLKFVEDLDQFHKTFGSSTIGFDEIVKQIQEASETVSKSIPKYPPYNIKQVKDNKWVIEMAVAGFAKSDIELTLDGKKLVIKGNAKEDEIEDSEFIFKGIANRDFTHQFTLADKVELKDAELVNGMLKVWLEGIVKVQDNIKKIAIK